MQEIMLDKDIILFDSPGVILNSQEQSDSLVLRQALKVEDLKDPLRPVEAIVSRVQKDQLLYTYKIAEFETVAEFIGSVARKKGLLQNGGVPNID